MSSLFWLSPNTILQQIGAGGALVGLTDGVVPFWAGATLITVFMIVSVVTGHASGEQGERYFDERVAD